MGKKILQFDKSSKEYGELPNSRTQVNVQI